MELRTQPLNLQSTFLLLGFDGFSYSEGRGFSRGIIVAWKSHVVQVQVLQIQFQFIHLQLDYGASKQWLLSVVYATPADDARRELWAALEDITELASLPWLLVGDFNDITFMDEKKGVLLLTTGNVLYTGPTLIRAPCWIWVLLALNSCGRGRYCLAS